MKLSEALMLGSTLGEEVSNASWDKCLLGIACHALGDSNFYNEAVMRWTWLTEKIVSHPDLLNGHPYSGTTFVTGLAIKVEEGRMTIQRAAEIVAEIEPAEVEVGEIQNEQADGRQVPIPKLSLEATKRR